MKQGYILPHSSISSLEGHHNIALIFGGTVYSESADCDMDPFLIVFDRTNKALVASMNQRTENTGILDFAIVNEGTNQNYVDSNLNSNSKYVDSISVGLNLDKIDEKFSVIVSVTIDQFILREVSHPMVRIVDVERKEEIYFCPFKPPIFEASGEMLFRIEKQDGNWVIAPVFQPVIDGKLLLEAVTDYVNHDCPVYDEFDLKLKPMIQDKGYQKIKNENMNA